MFYKVFLNQLSLLFLLFCSDIIFAEERLPELKKGMKYEEVLKLWGSPSEKIEKEVKRIDVWVYKNDTKIIFLNGVLISQVNKEGVDLLKPEVIQEKLNKEKEEKAKSFSIKKPEQDVVDDILNEIMKDPSNSEAGENRPANSGMINPGTPPGNVINQIPPPEIIN